MIRKHFGATQRYGFLAALCWCLVIYGFPSVSVIAVLSSFATLDHIINGP